MKHGYITDWISHDKISEEFLKKSSQFAERGCAEKKVILVGVAVFPYPNSKKKAGKSGEAGQCST